MKRKTAVGLAISAIFLYFAFRNADLKLLIDGLERTDPLAVVAVFAVMLVSMVFRALRWKVLFRSIHDISFGQLFSAAAIGLMANNLLPARLGEVVRAWAIGSRAGISKSSALATIVLERVLDGFTVLSFLAVMLLWRSEYVPGPVRKIAWAALAVCAAAGTVLFVTRRKRAAAERLMRRISSVLPKHAGERAGNIFGAFIDGLGALHSAGDLAASFALSFLVWIPNVVAVEVILRSFGLGLPLHAAVLVFTIVTFGIMIPSAPGFIGTIQYFFVLSLGLYGIAESLALSASIAYHVSVFIPVTATGIICMLRRGLSLASIRREAGGEISDDPGRPGR